MTLHWSGSFDSCRQSPCCSWFCLLTDKRAALYFQVFSMPRQGCALVELGMVDHIWLDKRADIAQTVDALGVDFKPAMHAGWMAYIRKVYRDGAADGGHAIGQGPLILDR